VVPVGFYEDVVAPAFGTRRGVVYVLPEMGPVRALFGAPRPEFQARADALRTLSPASPN
jgi:hypothetical protein